MKKTIIIITILLFVSFVFARDIDINRNTNDIRICSDYCRNNIYYYAGNYNYTENSCEYKRLFCDFGCNLETQMCNRSPDTNETEVLPIISDYNQKDNLIEINDMENNINMEKNIILEDDLTENTLLDNTRLDDTEPCFVITNTYYVTPDFEIPEGNNVIINLDKTWSIPEEYINKDDKFISIQFYIEDNIPFYNITKIEQQKLFGIIPVQKEKIIKVNASTLDEPNNNMKKIGEVCTSDSQCPKDYKCQSISQIDSSDLKRCNGEYIKKKIYAKECLGQESCRLDCSKFNGSCEEKIGVGCYVSYGAQSKGICLAHSEISKEKKLLEKNLYNVPEIFCKSLPRSWTKEWPDNLVYELSKEGNKLFFTCARAIIVKTNTSNCEGEYCNMEMPGFCYPKFTYNFYTGEFKYIKSDVKCYFAWEDPKNASILAYEKDIPNYQELYIKTINDFNSKKLFWYYWED